MSLKLFTVRDVKAEVYLPPFTMRSKGEAIRSFASEVGRQDSTIGAHPSDFVLFYLGEFDDSTCSFALAPAPESLGVGIDFVKVA